MEMKRMLKGIMLLVLGAAILSGCGPTNELRVKDVGISQKYLTNSEKKNGVNLLIEPYQSVGIRYTSAIKQGKVTVIKGSFPRMLFGEYFPGRIRWNVWFIREDGREFFAQAVFSGVGRTGQLEMVFIIDGVRAEVLNAKGMQISTMVDYSYDLEAKEFPTERAKFINDKNYRREMIMKHGTPVSNMAVVPDFLKVIQKWNAFDDADTGEKILTPLGTEEIKLIASINPQYAYWEKLVGTMRGAITADWIATAQLAAIDLIRAGNAPSTGADYLSEVPNRRYMGFVVDYIFKLYEEYIHYINNFNAACLGELERNALIKQPEKKSPEKISKRR
jgi:hypothetical protein